MWKWQFDKRTMKVLRIVTAFVVSIWLLLFVLPWLLLRIPSVQREVGKIASRELSSLLATPVSVGSVGLESGNVLSICELRVSDSIGRPMLSAQKLLGTFSWLDLLLEDEYTISTARLFGLDMELRQDPETGRFNMQHIIDHLASQSSDSASAPIALNTILVRDASLRWLRGADSLLVVDRLSAKVDRLRIAGDRISGMLDQFSAETPQGLQLERLSAQVDLRGSHLQVSNLQALLPNSQLSLPLVQLDMAQPGLRIIERCELASGTLSGADFASLYAGLRHLTEPLSAKVTLQREGDKLQVSGLDFANQEQAYCSIPEGIITLDEQGRYQGTNIPQISWGATMPWVKRLTQVLGLEAAPWVARLASLGSIQAESSLYHPRGATAQLQNTLRTDKGQLRSKTTLVLEQGVPTALDTSVETDEWQLTELLQGIAPIERLSFKATLKVYKGGSSQWLVEYLDAEIPLLQWAGNQVEQTLLRLKQTEPSKALYDLHLESQSPLARGQVDGAFAWQQGTPRDIRLITDIQCIDLSALGLVATPEPRLYSLVGSIGLDRLSLDTDRADIAVQHIAAWNESDTLSLSDIRAQLTREGGASRTLSLESPWFRGEVKGRYTLSSLPTKLYTALLERIPELSTRRASREATPTDITLAAVVDSIPQALTRIAGLPLVLGTPLSLRGVYNESTQALTFSASGDSLSYGGYTFIDWSAQLQDDSLLVGSDLLMPKDAVRYDDAKLRLVRAGEQLQLRLDLGRNSTGESNGVLSLGALLRRGAGERGSLLGAEVSLSPSELRVHNQLWRLSPAHISIYQQSLNVDRLRIETEGRSLNVSGNIGGGALEQLQVELNHINLGYILSAIGVDFDMLNMDLTGTALARLEGRKLVASAEVRSDTLLFERYPVGALDAKLSWDSKDMNIYLDGLIKQPQGREAHVGGHIRPADGAGIDLLFKARSLEVGFVSVFLDPFAEGVAGEAEGEVRLFGRFADGVSLAGDVDIHQGNIGIRALGTQYSFANRVRFTPTQILFDGVELRDRVGGQARLDGEISHRYFEDMRFNLNINEGQRIKVLESKQRNGLPIYGIAYGSGNARLRGSLDKIILDVDLKSEEGTDVTLDFTPTRAERNERLVIFKPLRPEVVDSLGQLEAPQVALEPEGAIDVHLNLEVTPVAKQTLRMGDGEGNELKGRTEGRLQINVPYVGTATVFGGLNVVEGSYVFRFEQLAHKRFTLRDGGRLDFRGDPMKADINLQASYALTANIADLDEELAVEARRTNVPVHCLLSLSGELTKPEVRFGIELPGAEAELERRVRSLLHTEDAVNRQMLYLIALGKFSPLEDKLNSKQDNTTSNLAAVASSALSEQLSYLLGNLSKDINIGTSIKTRNAGFEDTDIEFLFSGSWFDNRLLFNGNFGYHDNPFLQNTYIGEFDIEYKLNKPGTFRFKAYNHYNNMYQYLRQSLTTQGVGLLWRQRFDSLRDLLPLRHRRVPTQPERAPLDPLADSAGIAPRLRSQTE